VDHVEHANSKLLCHWCEPWRGVQSRPGVGEPLLPSLHHGRTRTFTRTGAHRLVSPTRAGQTQDESPVTQNRAPR